VHLKTLVVHDAISSHCRDAGSSMLVLIVKETVARTRGSKTCRYNVPA
jgi:hypothetical protein